MYSEWSTLSGINESASDRISVLDKLPPEAARDVVLPIVRNIVATLGISQPPLPSPFLTDKEVEWNLQVICFGLSLPLSEHEIIKDCVSIYCEWLSCLAPIPKVCVPKPITEQSNFYARQMINHLYHLFTPRKGEVQDTINRQAVLCHRVLRTLQNMIKISEIIDESTWECALLFLIGINDSLLSPPGLAYVGDSGIKEDIGDQLCDRILSVLFEVWLLACSKSFPSPVLWKSLRNSCTSWRHRGSLFEQWAKVSLLLTGRVLHVMYGMEYIKIEDDQAVLPKEMTDECVVQTWYRILHTVGNPVELTQPTIISQTQNFLQYAIASEAVVDPCQHPCLAALPGIFLQAMKGIAMMVDAFLGVPPLVPPPAVSKILELLSASTATIPEIPANSSSSIQPIRRLAKSFSVAPSTTFQKGLPKTSVLGLGRSKDTSSLPSSSQSSLQSQASVSIASAVDLLQQHRPLPSVLRPRVNSILNLFGPWLFEAALISAEASKTEDARRTSRGSAVPAALPENVDIPTAITIDKYYQGRAEALGTLCRIFCSKKTGEEIMPAYLARFFIAVRRGLSDTRPDVLGSILSNSSNLFRVDLDGVSILVPTIVAALETVLPQKDTLRSDLRRPAIQLLLSLLPLPLHFMNVPIKDFEKSSQNMTFLQLKPRLANLLLNTLQIEMDSINIQMLLGGLMMLVSDTSTFEEIEKYNMGNESPTQIISSENTSMKSFSDYSNSFDDHPVGHTFNEVDISIDSAASLFVRSIYLTCHRLISTWKSDLLVSLAALELLNGLAKIRLHDHDPLESRRAVKWICDFIMQQCSRPPPAHSKDLHSSIVAAFQCVTTWLTRHPFLLDDKDCLATVFEVVEYGISGTKSLGKPGEPMKHKDDKNQSPVSLRVRDAAEALLGIIFEQMSGNAATEVGSKSTELVDELSLFAQICDERLPAFEVIGHFRYYIMDQSVLIALLEDPIDGDSGTQPIVTAILRGPTGRHAWSLEHRHMSKFQMRAFGDNQGSFPGRPLPMNDVGIHYDIKQQYFPEKPNKVQPCEADKSIPPLEAATSDEDSLEQSRLSIILENQIRLEKRVATNVQEERAEAYSQYKFECNPPETAQEFQTARLLLSHLGFTSVQQISDLNVRQLVPVDNSTVEFLSELEKLDGTSCRTFDTVHLFYVRAGQSDPLEILNNVLSRSNVSPHFLEFLYNLGWPVCVNKHSGWTGNVATSWKRFNANDIQAEGDDCDKNDNSVHPSHGGCAFNGENQVLYWSDIISEISFVVPTSSPVFKKNNATHSTSVSTPPSSRIVMTETDTVKSRKNTIGAKTNPAKMFCVWLESFEDYATFPSGSLMSYCNTGIEVTPDTEPALIIFIQSMRNGLFRIHLAGPASKMGFATPLIDGMVLSRRVLGNLVRQTALNMAKRKRLENENSQPPHVRRKLKIQEIRNKFTLNLSESEMHTHFFKNLHSAASYKNGSGSGSAADENSSKSFGKVFV